MGKEERDEVLRWLEKDYDDARAAIDKFDGQLFTIRNWAVTSAGALLALGFSTDRAVVPLVGLLSMALFAYLETTYKCFHEDAMRRGHELENLINEARFGAREPAGHRFGLSPAFNAPTWARIRRVLKVRRHITFMYAGLAAALLAAAVTIAAGHARDESAPARAPGSSAPETP